MNLEAILQRLHDNPADEVKDYPLGEGAHVVSFDTAKALADLAQAVSAHGIVMIQECQPDLFTRVARTLLKPEHPGWRKNLPKGEELPVPVETHQKQTLADIFPEPDEVSAE